MSGQPTRRGMLRGAGVALALPWLESLAPRLAHAQAPSPPRRFVAMYFPCGVAQTYWKPQQEGTGAGWSLSPILEPLAPVKSRVTVLANVGNDGPFGGHVEPSHSNYTVAFLTCARGIAMGTRQAASCGQSIDQVIARNVKNEQKIPSLQVGLALTRSSLDGLPAACSRSISWGGPTEPLYKVVDPQAVFDRLVGTWRTAPGPRGGVDPFAAARRDANKSVLDYVLAHGTAVRDRMGKSDRQQLDAYFNSVRELEKRVAAGSASLSCAIGERPKRVGLVDANAVPAGYDRNAHADVMVDLLAMALRCDLTRFASYMLEDSRSDFSYSFLTKRTFTATGSTAGTETLGGLHGIASLGDSDDGYATTNRWHVEKLSRLCQQLAAMPEGAGTVLDNSVVWFGSEMHGANHRGMDLPVLYVGGGGGRLAVDRYVDFGKTARTVEKLANVYLTFAQKVFDLSLTSFGTAPAQDDGTLPPAAVGPGSAVVPEILA